MMTINILIVWFVVFLFFYSLFSPEWFSEKNVTQQLHRNRNRDPPKKRSSIYQQCPWMLGCVSPSHVPWYFWACQVRVVKAFFVVLVVVVRSLAAVWSAITFRKRFGPCRAEPKSAGSRSSGTLERSGSVLSSFCKRVCVCVNLVVEFMYAYWTKIAYAAFMCEIDCRPCLGRVIRASHILFTDTIPDPGWSGGFFDYPTFCPPTFAACPLLSHSIMLKAFVLHCLPFGFSLLRFLRLCHQLIKA